jgi:AcrR family transcriptional regulator
VVGVAEFASPSGVLAVTIDPSGEFRPQLGRRHWIDEARRLFVEKGVAAVKIDALARRLHVTRGSFYWHFEGRDDLLAALLADWQERATAPFARAFADARGTPAQRVLAFFEVWLDAGRFDPDLDSAMRDWARTSPEIDRAVRAVDTDRLGWLGRLYVGLGFGESEAEIRARVVYYHQVGYYALRITETHDYRRRLLPTYFRVLTGAEMPISTDQDES